jgi:hypothetical protein
MATKATLGYGAQLRRGDGATPENFAVVPEVNSLKGPGIKVDVKDATSQSSPSATKENIAGLIDSGQVTFDFNWVPGDATHAGILNDCLARTLRNWQLALPASIGMKWSFSAFVVGFDPGVPTDDKCMATVTLDITGPATLA